jgi:ABC-2 type transport system permease protein
MVSLLAAPVKRTTVAFTQMTVVISGLFLIIAYITTLEIVFASSSFPGELDYLQLITLNAGLLCLHLFIAGICYFSSCFFSDAKYSIGVSAGVPTLMYILQMLANMGGYAQNFKYATFFTLFNPNGIVAHETFPIVSIFVLFAMSVVLFGASIIAFDKRDLHI